MNNIEQTTPLRFIAQVDNIQKTMDRPLMLSGFGQLCTPWAFHQAAMHVDPIPMRPDPLPGDPDDVRVISDWQLGELCAGYHVVDSNMASGVLLLVRNKPVQLIPLNDTLITSLTENAEFTPLPAFLEPDTAEICLIFTATVTASDPAYGIHLVTEVLDSTGSTIRYDKVDMTTWTLLPSGAFVAITRYLPAPSLGGMRKAYIWNPRKTTIRLDNMRVRVMGMHR